MHLQHLLAPSSDVLRQRVLWNKASSRGRLIGQNRFCATSCNCTKQFCAKSSYCTKRVLCNKASHNKTGHLHSCGAKQKATKCILFLEQFCVKFAVHTVFGWKIRTAVLAFTDSGSPCGRQASQSWLKSSGRATKVLLAQTLSYFERGGVSRWTTLLAKHFLQQASRDISVSKQNSKTCKISI